MTERTLKISLGIFIGMLIVIGIWAATGFVGWQRSHAPSPIAEEQGTDARSHYTIALQRAQEWFADAKLAYIKSGSVGQMKGRSDVWEYTFVSSSAAGKGFLIQVQNDRVVSAEEIVYVGSGADFPANMVSQEEALSKVRAMPGYGDVVISGIEAVYGPSGKIWYWGIRTSKGTVSVEAQ